MAHQSFFSELRRRHVIRIALAYGVTAWLLVQLGAIVLPTFGAPHWVLKALVGLLILLFPVALILAWAFESTPEGVRRTVPAESGKAQPTQHKRRVGQTLNVGIIVVLAAAVGVLAWRQFGTRAQPQVAKVVVAATAGVPAPTTTSAQGTVIPAKSIAVLPFENLSSDKNNQYFADGMQDLILTKLASIGDLAVISRTSTLQYGSHPENLTLVGKQLGVATILEGSVQKVGDQVLVNVQLIDARNDHHIWADSYTRTLKNVFSVEGEVAQKIAATLKAKLSPGETKRLATTLSNNTAANDFYLQGDYFANRGYTSLDTAAMKHAIPFYRKAIAKAPDFAQARARLSITDSMLAWFGGGGENTAPLYAEALAQAEQALKLAPDLADAHLALGYYDYWDKGNYAEALKAFATALALRPNDIFALSGKAAVLRRQGRFREAIGVFQRALALDPRNSSTAADLGITYMLIDRYARAEQAFQRAIALDPTNVFAKDFNARAILQSNGDVSEALAQLQSDNPRLELTRVGFLTWARKYQQALTLLQSIPDSPDLFGDAPKSLQLAYLYGLSGASAKARALYAKALPQARAHFAALAGSRVIIQAEALINVAQAELGLGRTKEGLTDTAKALAMAEHSDDHFYGPVVMEGCAELYAQAGRADKAVQVLSAALATPGIGADYSPVMLWIAPVWDSIRNTPAFQALLKKYAKYRPATAPKASNGALK